MPVSVTSTLRNLTNDQLLSSTRIAVSDERRAALAVLEHLQVIQDRKIYLERGFPSLFEFCTKELGYSNGAAQRRIQAMRLMKEVPEVQEKIQSGQISISSAAQIQSFLQLEKKEDHAYTKTEKLELLATCEGKSSRDVEKELARRNPEVVRRDSIRAVDEDNMRLTITVSDDLWRKIERLRALRSHTKAHLKTEELLAWLVELGLDKADPVRKAERAQKRSKHRDSFASSERDDRADFDSLPTSEVRVRQTGLPRAESVLSSKSPRARRERTRYINAEVTHRLSQSQKGGCSYVDPRTGRRCGSPYFLQRDHIEPYSEGGSNDAANLRWYCGPHNRARNAVIREGTRFYQAV